MKNLSKVAYASAACLMLGASGIAHADNCEHGLIAFKTVGSIVVEAGEVCVIYQVTVNFNISAGLNSAVVIQDSFIGGNVDVNNAASFTITDSTVSEGSITVRTSDTVALIDNDVLRGSMTVTGNRRATVKKNEIDQLLFCTDNNRIDSRLNRANGEDACPNNLFN